MQTIHDMIPYRVKGHIPSDREKLIKLLYNKIIEIENK